MFPLSLSYVISLEHSYIFAGKAWVEGRGKLALYRYTWTAVRKRTVHIDRKGPSI